MSACALSSAGLLLPHQMGPRTCIFNKFSGDPKVLHEYLDDGDDDMKKFHTILAMELLDFHRHTQQINLLPIKHDHS